MNHRLSLNLVLDALSIACCHHFCLPRHAYLTMFSNSGGNYNSAAEIVLSALKYGAPCLAVGAMVLKFYADCNLFV